METIEITRGLGAKEVKLFHIYFHFSGCECDININNSVVRILMRFRTLLTLENVGTRLSSFS